MYSDPEAVNKQNQLMYNKHIFLNEKPQLSIYKIYMTLTRSSKIYQLNIKDYVETTHRDSM
jgi:hypothetical protein